MHTTLYNLRTSTDWNGIWPASALSLHVVPLTCNLDNSLSIRLISVFVVFSLLLQQLLTVRFLTSIDFNISSLSRAYLYLTWLSVFTAAFGSTCMSEFSFSG